jgi:hypothetical protein
MDISLDDGQNWKRVEENMFDNWVSTDSWSMNSKSQLKTRFKFERPSEMDDEPVLDDFFVMWRV